MLLLLFVYHRLCLLIAHEIMHARCYRPHPTAMGWLEGVCQSSITIPSGVISYNSQLECCQSSYAGQTSGACMDSLTPEVKATLREVWFPIYADQKCESSMVAVQAHGIPGYDSQLDCCMAEYRHKVLPCLEGMDNPPVIEEFWYPDYTRGWVDGICIKGPVPNGVISFSSQEACCRNGE